VRFVIVTDTTVHLFFRFARKEEKMNISIKEETLGQRIRAQRIRLGMTQEELAEITFIPKPTISNYENDRIDIKSSVIAELAKALETDPNYLILGEKAPEVANGFMNEAEGLFSKITDPKVQEMLLKQIRALV
jgi:transcriptional regulator with XRE-family HTH domain